MITLEERKKKKRTLFQEEKENRQSNRMIDDKAKMMSFEETKVYFTILALKILLKEP